MNATGGKDNYFYNFYLLLVEFRRDTLVVSFLQKETICLSDLFTEMIVDYKIKTQKPLAMSRGFCYTILCYSLWKNK